MSGRRAMKNDALRRARASSIVVSVLVTVAFVVACVASTVAAQEPSIERTSNLEPRGRDAEGEGSEREDVVGSLGQAIHDIGEAMGEGAPSRARIAWDPRWPRYHVDELVLTLGLGLVMGLAELLPTRSDPNWSGVTDFDSAAQRALGLTRAVEREGLAVASDVLVTALVLWPVAIDSLLYAGVGEGAWDVAWQLSLISLEVFAINHALNITLKLLSRRERPIGRQCREEPGYADNDPACVDPPPAESFWSGHVSNAFAGAALVCMHHDMLDLFGDAGADGAACGTALTMAAATGLFRIMSDRHWITDVLAGAVVGSLIGTLVPWLLHYQGGARPPLRGTEAPPIALAPMVGEGTFGVSAFGLW